MMYLDLVLVGKVRPAPANIPVRVRLVQAALVVLVVDSLYSIHHSDTTTRPLEHMEEIITTHRIKHTGKSTHLRGAPLVRNMAM
jgi:hypothetical protein